MEDLRVTEEEMVHLNPNPVTPKITYKLHWLETEAHGVNLSGIAVSSEGQIAVADITV